MGGSPQVISHGDKIAQAVLVPVVPFRAYCRHDGDLYSYPITMSDRGDGALGSTDKLVGDNIKHSDIYSHASKSD